MNIGKRANVHQSQLPMALIAITNGTNRNDSDKLVLLKKKKANNVT